MKNQLPTHKAGHVVLSNYADIAKAQNARRQEAAGITPMPKAGFNPMGWGVRFDPLRTGTVEDRRGIEGLIAAGKPGAAAILECPWIYMNDEPVECSKPNQGAC